MFHNNAILELSNKLRFSVQTPCNHTNIQLFYYPISFLTCSTLTKSVSKKNSFIQLELTGQWTAVQICNRVIKPSREFFLIRVLLIRFPHQKQTLVLLSNNVNIFNFIKITALMKNSTQFLSICFRKTNVGQRRRFFSEKFTGAMQKLDFNLKINGYLVTENSLCYSKVLHLAHNLTILALLHLAVNEVFTNIWLSVVSVFDFDI